MNPKPRSSNAKNTSPVPCGLWRRGAVMLYDGLLVIAIVFIAAAAALPLTGTRVQVGQDIGYTLYVVLAWFAYLGVCWTHKGQTLGMRAWRVTLWQPGQASTQALRLGWAAAALRFATSLLAAVALGLGFWSSLWREDKACWHDRASNSYLRVHPKKK